ncbi:uncharacterized protein [Spinacia oleracea]|uniref:Reverse transcriptase domain-containing protein n=1 Tax=Spinacia oleracea TaxID=3562 RepID=A0ABM3QQ57_SPIOL|nr:uncharacterized protein LOC110786952 [Spinacia oleracea]
MQRLIGQVVSEFQFGFIPERWNSDNILLATELIKGYTRAHLSPRCLLKVDLKKAYDSIEWSFLQSLMIELGFPDCFVAWVITCITTVSYSININGKPSVPFCAKNGPRQGDPCLLFSLQLVYVEYLTRYLQYLQHQPDFNFHPKCEKLATTHMMFDDDLLMLSSADLISVFFLMTAFNQFSTTSDGSFPFRYLGVPLTTKKLVYNQCRPLINKVVARAKTWTAKHLPYPGRLQLCLQFHRQPFTFEMVLILRASKRTGDRYKLLMMFFAECIYGIWLQRNTKVFK